MSELAKKFGIPQSLLDVAKKTFDESTEYQNKVKAHMAKKGIKSLGDLSPEEKKKFFNDLDAAHKAKNEEVKIDESDAYDKDRYAVKNGKAVKDNPSHAGSANSKDQPHHVWASNEKDALDKMKKKNVKESEEKDDEEDDKKMKKNGKKKDKEEVEEAIVKGKGYDKPENERKAPEGKVPMTSLLPGHNDKAARLAAVQAKGTLVKGKAQSASQKTPQKESYELTQEDIEFINSLNERK